jgi:adenine-specific DNA-methyltransferase
MNKLKLEELIKSYSGEKLADLLFQAGFEKSTKNLDSLLPVDDIFSSSLQLGEIKTNDNQKVLVVETKVSSDLSERSSRKKQFDIGKKLLQNNQAYAAGLLVFYDEKGNFRLSLVHPKFEGTKRSYNSFKRYTFYVNPAHSNKTFINQFSGASFATLDSIKEVFSVAKVTFDFFKEYKRLFEQIVESIKKDEHFPDFAEKNGVTINDVAKKLLGQIVFLYFLQRKGWLGATKGQHVSKGDQNFLRTLFNKAKEAEAAHPDIKMNFFNDYLEYLFYDALNKPITDNATSCYRQRFECQIPFLNGGLFEPIPEYKWQQRFLQLPDDIFSNKNETGVLDIFDSYNFTIDENSADDQEVSVDPEMLGKVFENLLEENLRKGTGSFYTPREIVQYMVTESLKQYLRDKTDISEEKISAVLEEYHNECEVSEDEAEKIDNALKEVRVVDPACGSGAFLVGLLQEIAHIRHYCQRCYQTQPQTYYQIKKEIIRDSIYGVDLDGGAVDIARLRFWLSMVVDHDIDIDDIEPLPNLDYKLMQGNSLLEDMYVGDIKIKLDFESGKKIDRRTKQAKMFDDGEEDVETQTLGFSEDTGDRIADKLVRHHNEFFAEKDPIKKALLKKKIDSLESELIVAGHDDAVNALDSQLKNSQKDAEKNKIKERIEQVKSSRENWLKFKIRPYFPWKLHFSEVFEKGGFHIVAGNPPYVNVEKIDRVTKEALFLNYLTCTGRTDLYVAFIEMSMRMLQKGGVLTFIIPYAFTNQKYATEARNQLINKFSIFEIVDTSEYLVFDTANVKNIILFVQKIESGLMTKIRKVNSSLNFERKDFNDHTVPQKMFLQLKDNRLETKPFESLLELKDKLQHNSVPLKDICFVGYGARLNHKDKKHGKSFYVSNEAAPGNVHFTEGKCIQRYTFSQYGWLKYTPSEHYNPMFRELFENEKLMTINVVKDKLRFAYDTDGFFNSHTVINCVKYDLLQNVQHVSVQSALKKINIEQARSLSYKYLLGILNSSTINWYFKNFLSESLHFYPDDAKNLPIKMVDAEIQKSLSELVDKVISGLKNNIATNDVETEINEMVMNLYGLTEEEKVIIRNS